MDLWKELSLGVAGGMGTAAALWLVTRLLAPRIRWSEAVSVRESAASPTGRAYFVQIQNRSVRPILDLRLRAEVVIKQDHADGWLRIPIPMSHENMPHLSPRNKRALQLDLENVPEMTRQIVEDRLGADAPLLGSPNRRLRTMLQYGDKSNYLVVGVLAKDALSGREKYLRSRFYRAHHVKAHPFASQRTEVDNELNRRRTWLKNLYDRLRPELPLNTGKQTVQDDDF